MRSIHVLYIYHKNEKGKPGEMDLPLLKNDITGSEPTVTMLDTLQKSQCRTLIFQG